MANLRLTNFLLCSLFLLTLTSINSERNLSRPFHTLLPNSESLIEKNSAQSSSKGLCKEQKIVCPNGKDPNPIQTSAPTMNGCGADSWPSTVRSLFNKVVGVFYKLL